MNDYGWGMLDLALIQAVVIASVFVAWRTIKRWLAYREQKKYMIELFDRAAFVESQMASLTRRVALVEQTLNNNKCCCGEDKCP